MSQKPTINPCRDYRYLMADEVITLANGGTYTAQQPGVYIVFENGSVLGPYRDYDEAEQSADATVNDWHWRR